MGKNTDLKKVELLGVRIDAVNQAQARDTILGFVKKKSKFSYVVTPNPEMLVAARENEGFQAALNEADLSVADGTGLLIAQSYLDMSHPRFKLLDYVYSVVGFYLEGLKHLIGKRPEPLPERVAGADLVTSVFSSGVNLSIYLLGGVGEMSSEAAKSISDKYSNVTVVGCRSGGEVSDQGVGQEDAEIISEINGLGPDLILVGFGAPKQELWMHNNQNRLNVRVAMGVGGTLDFYAGYQKRAPEIVRLIGLEWIWRLATDPRRWKRIIRAFVVFPYYITLNRLRMVKLINVPQS